MTLQVFVPAAACTPHQWHTGRAVDVLHLRRVLVHHLHQLLNGSAEAATPHFLEQQHCTGERKHESASRHGHKEDNKAFRIDMLFFVCPPIMMLLIHKYAHQRFNMPDKIWFTVLVWMKIDF